MKRMEAAVRTLISGIGEDLEREGLRDTPKVRRGRARPAAQPLTGCSAAA
jgi:GTP cyclohydrolase I